MKFFIGLFGGAFGMMKNGVCFIVIALLVVELFKVLVCAGWMTGDITLWTRDDVTSQKME